MEYRIKAYIKETLVATPIGEDTEATFNAMLAGKSVLENASEGCISAFSPQSRWYGMNTGDMIIEMAGEIARKNSIDYSDPSVLLIISTTKGDIKELENGEYLLSSMAESAKEALGCANLPLIVSNACISGVSATIVAKRYIEKGLYKNIVVAGCDRISDFIYSGFDSFKSLSATPCRPYDANRCGLNLGEAGACLLISSEGDIEIKGGAITNDANHISGPSRTGDGLFYAIEEAMVEAYGTLDHPVEFINAHGTATLYNDEMESKAIALAGMAAEEGKEGVPVNSLKGYIGHTLGASGVVEIALCAKQLEHGVILPVKGFSEHGVPTPINVVKDSPIGITSKSSYGEGRNHINCIKTASGFGGCNAAVVLEKAGEAERKNRQENSGNNEKGAAEEYSYKKYIIADGRIEANGNLLFQGPSDFAPFIREAYKKFCSPNMKFYKMDDLCKLGYVAASILFDEKDMAAGAAERRDTAIVLANEVSSLDSDMKHWEAIKNNGTASPAVFVYTLPNLVLGEICIRHKIKGENTFFITPRIPQERGKLPEIPDFIREYAHILMERKSTKRVIYGWCSYYDNQYCAIFELVENLN